MLGVAFVETRALPSRIPALALLWLRLPGLLRSRRLVAHDD
jgi:hypothetical protein